jgi:NAD(P)-dependent dehydrogenase (short-subunit alcohol dehydrogenase family)
MDITNKRVLLTGGSSGIGKAMIDELHRFNTSIVVGDLNPEAIQHHTKHHCHVL